MTSPEPARRRVPRWCRLLWAAGRGSARRAGEMVIEAILRIPDQDYDESDAVIIELIEI